MPKITAPTKTEAAEPELGDVDAAIVQSLGGLLEPGDRVEAHTHSGGVFSGVVDDANVSGFVLLAVDAAKHERVFLLPYAAIDHLEIFVEAEGGGGEPVDEEEAEGERTDVDADGADEGEAEGGDVTPIGKVA